MDTRDAIRNIMYAIYGTDNYYQYQDISKEQYEKTSLTENLISDMIKDVYGINPIQNNGKYTKVKKSIIDEYDYQTNTQNNIGHTLLAYWPSYKRNFVIMQKKVCQCDI